MSEGFGTSLVRQRLQNIYIYKKKISEMKGLEEKCRLFEIIAKDFENGVTMLIEHCY